MQTLEKPRKQISIKIQFFHNQRILVSIKKIYESTLVGNRCAPVPTLLFGHTISFSHQSNELKKKERNKLLW